MVLAGHAGGVVNGEYNHGKSNLKYYLFSGQEFWTMTPAGYYVPYFQSLRSKNFSVLDSKNSIDDTVVSFDLAYKPVINIRSDVTITGTGTTTDPYVVA